MCWEGVQWSCRGLGGTRVPRVPNPSYPANDRSWTEPLNTIAGACITHAGAARSRMHVARIVNVYIPFSLPRFVNFPLLSFISFPPLGFISFSAAGLHRRSQRVPCLHNVPTSNISVDWTGLRRDFPTSLPPSSARRNVGTTSQTFRTRMPYGSLSTWIMCVPVTYV